MGVAHGREAEHRVAGERAGAPLRGPWIESRMAEIAGEMCCYISGLLHLRESGQTEPSAGCGRRPSCRSRVRVGIRTGWRDEQPREPPPADRAVRHEAGLGRNRLAVASPKTEQRGRDELRQRSRVRIGHYGWT